MKKLIIILSVIAVTFTACQKDEPAKPQKLAKTMLAPPANTDAIVK